MNDEAAKVRLTAARRAGDTLMAALHQLKGEIHPSEFDRWKGAVGRSMGGLYGELLGPLCEEHPSIVPKSLGGPAPD